MILANEGLARPQCSSLTVYVRKLVEILKYALEAPQKALYQA